MKYYLSNREMRSADAAAIAAGTSSEELMARAGRAIADEVLRVVRERGAGSVLFVCGTGNNGGDGYVAARLLSGKVPVSVYASEGRYSEDCLREKARYDGAYAQSVQGDVVVDCIFGTGLTRAVEGDAANLIGEINSCGAYIISADIPSGLNGDNGIAEGAVVRADLTVAIGSPKLGHILSDGKDVCGEVRVKDIGIPADGMGVPLAERADVASFFPPRKRNTHKGSYGSCCIVAGDRYMGAAALSLSSALVSGCGYVIAAVREKLALALVAAYPQAVYVSNPDLKCGAIAFGMGMGCDEGVYDRLRALLEEYEGCLIIDADGINALAAYGVEVLGKVRCRVVLTPHVKEFSRISGLSVREILADPVKCVGDFARKHGVCVHLKGAVTVTSDGHRCVLADRGNSALAKAGSGDMLSGLIAGYAARGLTPFDAAFCAQYVLGSAAEGASAVCGEYCVTADDIIKNIKTFVKSLTSDGAQ